jgi:hypothetical protein
MLDRLRELRLPNRAGDHGGQPVLRGDQVADPIELGTGGQGVEILGGQCVQGRLQLAHDTSERPRSGVRSLPRTGIPGQVNPQVSALSTDFVQG